MQQPTCRGIRIRSLSDAHVIFHAVSLNLLPMVSRRLDMEERRFIHSGCVCVWEERGGFSESSVTGIERWTDGRRWGPSRVRDEFLYYHEKLPELSTSDAELSSLIFGSGLVKQTYSVYVDTPTGRRKWHLVAYFTPETLERLHTIDDVPELAALRDLVPEGKYTTARVARHRPRSDQPADNPDPQAAPRVPPLNLDPGPCRRHSIDVSLPTVKPPPWSPTWVVGELAARYPDFNQAQSQSAVRERSASIDLAPLIYLKTRPYPPRSPADCDALRSFDCAAAL